MRLKIGILAHRVRCSIFTRAHLLVNPLHIKLIGVVAPAHSNGCDTYELLRHNFRPRPLRFVSQDQWATPSLLLSATRAIAEEQRAKTGA